MKFENELYPASDHSRNLWVLYSSGFRHGQLRVSHHEAGFALTDENKCFLLESII